MNALAHHRFPWTTADEAFVIQAKQKRVRHKVIARELNRTPRSVDEQVARMKERGVLKMHRAEELDLLKKIEAEERKPEIHRDGD